MKHPMGIIIVRSKVNNKCYLQATQDIRGAMNGLLVRLKGGRHPNKELMAEWIKYGEDNFNVEVLVQLEYDKDEENKDYTEDLALLQLIWEEKLTEQGSQFYKKRLTE